MWCEGQRVLMLVPKPVYSELYATNSSAWMNLMMSSASSSSSAQDQVISGLELFCQHIVNTTRAALDGLATYVDLDYMLWIRWLLSPIILTFFILPTLIVIFIYLTALILYIYRAHRKRLLHRLQQTVFEDRDFWEAGRQIVSTFWDAHAWLWHGYEIRGLENLPAEEGRGCLLVYYHGAIPVDYYYLVNRVLLLKRVVIHSVVDKFLYRMPGMRIILDVFCCTPGSVDSCAELLRQGALLGISPGGVFEAQFGDHSYEVLWRQRLGFARAALQANVPVVPIFTQNIREAFRVVPLGSRLFYWIFERTKIPLRPLFGGFPVKLVTHIGPAIYPEEGMTPEVLRDRCKAALEALIADNQRRPGNIFHGILDRFWRRRVHND